MYATANLAVGLVLAFTQPSRADDLWIVYDWCRSWLVHGQQLYAGIEARTDYPPNAIVVLSPLALVPRSWIVPVWALLSLVVTPIYARLAVIAFRSRTQTVSMWLPILLFLCWGGTRTVLEFSRLSMTLAITGAVLADSRPVASGVSLGLAMMKPHMAGPVVLWALLTKRMRVVLIAAGVIAAGIAVYCVRAHASPLAVATDYRSVLQTLYFADDPLQGRTSLQPWLRALVGDRLLGDATLGAVGVVLALVPCVIALRPRLESSQSYGTLALLCLISLLTVYHIGSNVVVLMLPAFVFLLMADDPPSFRWRMCFVGAIQLVLMLDIPVHAAPFVSESGIAFLIVRDVDRVLVLATFTAVAILLLRPTRQVGARE